MGSVKPRIPTGKFVILNRINTKGETVIHLRYFWGRYAKRSTGISIPPSVWDENKCSVKSSYPDSAQINARLQNLKCEIDNKLLAYEGEMNMTVLNFILNGGDPTDEGDLPDTSPTQVVTRKTNFVEYAKRVNDLNYSKKEYDY